MPTNLLTNGDFETGDLTGWTLTFGTPIVIADSEGPFGGVFAMQIPDELLVVANNTGPSVVAGEKFFGSFNIRLVSGTGAISIALGSGSPFQGGLIMIFTDGRVEYRDGSDHVTVLRSETIEDPTTRFTVNTAWQTTRAESAVGIGPAQPATLFDAAIPAPFDSTAEWVIDDCWVGRDPQPQSVSRPGNGPGRNIFQESHYDEIHGTLHKRKDITVDFKERIRNAEDVIRRDRTDSFRYAPNRRRFVEP